MFFFAKIHDNLYLKKRDLENVGLSLKLALRRDGGDHVRGAAAAACRAGLAPRPPARPAAAARPRGVSRRCGALRRTFGGAWYLCENQI